MIRPGGALAILLAVLVAGCMAARPGGAPVVGSPERGPLRLLLRADRQVYGRGEPVTFTLTVSNPGPAPVSVTAPSSQLHDFALSRDGAEVWRWSEGKAFLTMITEWTLPPGGMREFTVRWDQRNRDGRPVEPGTYVAEARLVGGDKLGPRPRRIPITIR
jgi:hypothetical protein